MRQAPKLGLGTVQFGMDYGVSNQHGQCPPEEVERILGHAAKGNFVVLDTAAAYGASEATLGKCLPPDHAFRVVTKAPPLKCPEATQSAVEMLFENFERSLERLGQKSVHGLLVHRGNDLMGPGGQAVWQGMERLRDMGRVTRIGASAYCAEEIETLIDCYPLEIIQTPFNAFDQSLGESGCLQRLKNSGVEIHVRSAFLQGVLLMAPDDLPDHLAPAHPALEAWRNELAKHGLSPLEGALAFVRQWPAIDVMVLGVTRTAELLEIERAASVPIPKAIDWSQFAVRDPAIIDPRSWPTVRQDAQQGDHAA
ncbi:MAG: aldo/keto reductase [Sphingomonadales bacterium]